MKSFELSLDGGRLESPPPTPEPEFLCGECLWSRKRIGAIADALVMRRVTLFPFLPNPLVSVCSGSGFDGCECHDERSSEVRAYSEPITKPGAYLREILFLCETCRMRLEASREIEILTQRTVSTP